MVVTQTITRIDDITASVKSKRYDIEHMSCLVTLIKTTDNGDFKSGIKAPLSDFLAAKWPHFQAKELGSKELGSDPNSSWFAGEGMDPASGAG
jgi:hypothetical protein